MSVKLLTEHHLEFLNSKGGCTGSSEFTLVKMPHCWKSHAAAQLYNIVIHILVIQCRVSTSRQKAAELISNQFEYTTSEAIREWEHS